MRSLQMLLIFVFSWSLSFQLFAQALSFSARLVNSDGSPVTGPVDLRFELVYSDSQSDVLCNDEVETVSLSSGVFHVNLNFDGDCGGPTLQEVMADAPDGESVMIRVSDITDSADIKSYPYQALNYVPFSMQAELAKTLHDMGATDGQVLKWESGEWVPSSDEEGEEGTITEIIAGTGLDGGTITTTGTISIADDGVTGDMLADNAVINDKILNETIRYSKLDLNDGDIPATKLSGLGDAAFYDVGLASGQLVDFDSFRACADDEKLQLTTLPTVTWRCIDDSDAEDDTKLPLDGSEPMAGILDMDDYALINLPEPMNDADAATRKYVDDRLADKVDSTEMSDYVAVAGDVMTGHLDLNDQSELRLGDNDSTNYVSLRAPMTVGSDVILTLPDSAGTSNQVLTTDGSGNLTWTTPADEATPEGSAGGDLSGTYPNPMIANDAVTGAKISDETITNADIANTTIEYGKLNLADASIPQAKVIDLETDLSALSTDIAAKQNDLGNGAAGEYLAPDRSWQTLDSDVVDEGVSNLYFRDERAQAATVQNAINDNETDIAPSQEAVFEALALKADDSDLGNYVEIVGDAMTGPLDLNDQSELRLRDDDSSNYVSLRAPAIVGADVTLTFPDTAGTSDQVLTTDGSGNLTWTTPADAATPEGSAGGDLSGTYPNPSVANNAITGAKILDETITNADITDATIEYVKLNLADESIPQAKIIDLETDLSTINSDISGKQNDLGDGDPGDYLAFDRTWQTLTSDVVGEGTSNLYFTGERAQIAAVQNAINDNEVDLAPSQEAVFEALALKADDSDLGNYVEIAGDAMTGPLDLNAQNELRLRDSDSSNYVSFRAPATVGADVTLTFPDTAGTSDQVLSTDGAGILTWTTPSDTAIPEGSAGGELNGTYPNPTLADDVIDDANVMSGANINALKIGTGVVDNTEFNFLEGVTTSLQDQLDDKEDAITAGTSAQYWSGDKSWETLNTDAVNEASQLYFTDERAKDATLDDAIVDGVVDRAPSQNAVNDALALKADASSLSNYVLKAGDTMTGALNLPVDGLTIGTNQLVASDGRIGVGTDSPTNPVHVYSANPTGMTIERTSTNNSNIAFRNPDGVMFAGLNPNENFGIGPSQDLSDGSLIVTPSGEVGIGTSNPEVSLDLNGRQRTLATTATAPTSGKGLELFYSSDNDRGVVFAYDRDASVEQDLGLGGNGTAMLIKGSGDVGVGTNTPAEKLDVAGNARFNGLPVGSFNPFTGFAVSNQDYTHFTEAMNGTYTYSEADGGILTSGSTWFFVRTRLPVDEDAIYRASLRVEKLSGDGTVYLGANSLDDNFQELRSDDANSYNYFAARSDTVAAGEEKTFTGIISGFNSTTGTSSHKFDPGAKYFDLVVITNHNGTGESVIKSIEVEKLPIREAWQTVTFENSWVDYGGSYNPAGYTIDKSGFVRLRGLIKSGTIDTCAFTLPEGYRPENTELLSTMTSGHVPGRVDVRSDGCVFINEADASWITLDGLSFRAYQ